MGGRTVHGAPLPQPSPSPPEACSFLFVHLFFIPKHLLNTCYVPGSVLGTKDSVWRRTDTVSLSGEWEGSWRGSCNIKRAAAAARGGSATKGQPRNISPAGSERGNIEPPSASGKPCWSGLYPFTDGSHLWLP